jgi:hypothetical protein
MDLCPHFCSVLVLLHLNFQMHICLFNLADDCCKPSDLSSKKCKALLALPTARSAFRYLAEFSFFFWRSYADSFSAAS